MVSSYISALCTEENIFVEKNTEKEQVTTSVIHRTCRVFIQKCKNINNEIGLINKHTEKKC